MLGTTILTAKRLGWTFKNAEIVTTDAGEDLDFTRDSPAFIRDQVRGAVRRTVAREIDDIMPMLRSYGRGQISKGIRRTLRRSGKLKKTHSLWDNKFAGDLQSAVCNGHRLHRAGLSDDKRYNLCLAETGSPEHRYTCPRTSKTQTSRVPPGQTELNLLGFSMHVLRRLRHLTPAGAGADATLPS